MNFRSIPYGVTPAFRQYRRNSSFVIGSTCVPTVHRCRRSHFACFDLGYVFPIFNRPFLRPAQLTSFLCGTVAPVRGRLRYPPPDMVAFSRLPNGSEPLALRGRGAYGSYAHHIISREKTELFWEKRNIKRKIKGKNGTFFYPAQIYHAFFSRVPRVFRYPNGEVPEV